MVTARLRTASRRSSSTPPAAPARRSSPPPAARFRSGSRSATAVTSSSRRPAPARSPVPAWLRRARPRDRLAARRLRRRVLGRHLPERKLATGATRAGRSAATRSTATARCRRSAPPRVPSPRDLDFSRNGRFLYAVSPGNATTGGRDRLPRRHRRLARAPHERPRRRGPGPAPPPAEPRAPLQRHAAAPMAPRGVPR